MTKEEKAKRYDKALDRAKKELDACGSQDCDAARQIFRLFPELCEPEGERIRKELLEHCKSQAEPYILTGNKCPQIQSWIAWIEKQGQTFTKEDTDNANKVEPKFKADDWVVSPNGGYWHIDRIENNRYEVTSDTGKCACAGWPLDTDLYHLWTIQDAKKGDVLACGKCILIFDQLSEFNNEQVLMDICHCTSKGFYWQDTKDRDLWVLDGFKPATKEQQDTLFAKMREAGYEWDAEKKELKKISQRMISAEAKEAMYGNPAWSEEDEKAINDILWIIEAYRKNGFNETHIQMADNSEKWLKSLKQRIKL